MPGGASRPAPIGDGEGTETGDKADVASLPTPCSLDRHNLKAILNYHIPRFSQLCLAPLYSKTRASGETAGARPQFVPNLLG